MDLLAINTIRTLSMDGVQAANSGQTASLVRRRALERRLQMWSSCRGKIRLMRIKVRTTTMFYQSERL